MEDSKNDNLYGDILTVEATFKKMKSAADEKEKTIVRLQSEIEDYKRSNNKLYDQKCHTEERNTQLFEENRNLKRMLAEKAKLELTDQTVSYKKMVVEQFGKMLKDFKVYSKMIMDKCEDKEIKFLVEALEVSLEKEMKSVVQTHQLVNVQRKRSEVLDRMAKEDKDQTFEAAFFEKLFKESDDDAAEEDDAEEIDENDDDYEPNPTPKARKNRGFNPKFGQKLVSIVKKICNRKVERRGRPKKLVKTEEASEQKKKAARKKPALMGIKKGGQKKAPRKRTPKRKSEEIKIEEVKEETKEEANQEESFLENDKNVVNVDLDQLDIDMANNCYESNVIVVPPQENLDTEIISPLKTSSQIVDDQASSFSLDGSNEQETVAREALSDSFQVIHYNNNVKDNEENKNNEDIDMKEETREEKREQEDTPEKTPKKRRKLENEKPFSCEECGKNYVSNYGLRRHLKSKIHCPDSNENPSTNTSNVSDVTVDSEINPTEMHNSSDHDYTAAAIDVIETVIQTAITITSEETV